MAGPEARALWAKMREDPENKVCIDCGSNNPQWASIPFGILFCLECSGIHRGLGVHIDFVRSLTMDSWSEKQLSNMRVGGNRNCKDFFRSHKISLSSSIKDRYSSHVAEIYKQKIKALSEGQTWTPPPGFSASLSPSPTSAPVRSLPRQQSTPSTLPNRGRGQPVKKSPKGQPVATDAWEDEWNDIVVSTPALGQPKYSSPSFVSTSSALSPNDDFAQTNIRLTNSTSPSFISSTTSAKPKRPTTNSTHHHLATDSDLDTRTNDDPDFEKATLHHSSSFNSYLSESPPKPSYLLPSEPSPRSTLAYSPPNPPSTSSSTVNDISTIPPASALLTTGYELLNKIGTVAYNAASYSTKLATEKIETINTSLVSYGTQPVDPTAQGSTWDYVSSYLQTATDTIKQLAVAADPSSDPRQTSYLTDTGPAYNPTTSDNYPTGESLNNTNGLKSNGRPPAVQIEEDSWFENTTNNFNAPVSNNRKAPQKSSENSSAWDGFENNDTQETDQTGWDGWDDWGESGNPSNNTFDASSGPARGPKIRGRKV